MSTTGRELPEENFVSEDELKSLLERWIVPEPSKTLDQRVANSYHREMGRSDPAIDLVPFPQSHNEVVTMKFCPSCKEEFADKFSFCPVDGTPLTAHVSEPENKVVESASFSKSAATSEPVLQGVIGAGSMARSIEIARSTRVSFTT